MADAFKFLQRVREKIGAENEEKYNEFLDVLRGYEEKEIVPAEATRRVEALLGGDTELWEEFKGFLPDVGRREEEDEDEDEEDDEGQEEEEEEEGREEVESLLVKEEAGPVDGEGRSSNHTGLGQDKASSPVQGNLLKGGGSDEGGKEGGQEGGQEGGKECLSRADASPSGL
ncbi:paired amphipathic helix repeat-containing protein [Nannochloropsis gaditana CCMP526]|uniref:paired amphipathic helix repeat-containing protein n=1 Tax=Nannochloropsis gaditana (strain CCMP526) TaxID=1093141 RepID=UPI00029F6D42|nr:paired amphipathic helix repeat-containing protein [Nannochloropsis gaditana CCMP526]EKU20600.1 paired amphipathic helix repeat-containing protein [Nannochloropsis gaditana CCMP526]|eukprot:XP_005855759.1 paired amphipathic helix repeat-containing protein [Nannochloropsis gaditana CCMP526]